MTNSRSGALLDRRIGAQRPNRLHLPAGVASLEAGEDCCEFAATAGLVLDDWQQWLVWHTLAERLDGYLAALIVLWIVSRQNGKGSALEAVELNGLYVECLDEQIHSAHLADTSAAHMARLKSIIRNDPELDAKTQIYESNGKEKIVNLETGGVISFSTRSKSTKRGRSPKRIVFDEALFLTDEQLQAMVPALAARSMDADGLPQMIFTSSAPLPESAVLHRLRKQGLSGVVERMFYAEWGADVGVNIFDVDQWYATNPAMGIRISEEYVREAELATLTPEAFMIERLGVVFDPDGVSTELPEWAQRRLAQEWIPGDPEAVTVDVALDGSWSSIGVAVSGPDGRAYVEVVDHLPGTDAVVSVLVAMWECYRLPVHLDPRSPAGALVAPLRAAGVEVVEVGGLDVVKACAELKQAVRDDTVCHRGQGPLDAAVAGASIKAVDDGWKWTRRSSSADISPLYAVTLALHAYRSVKATVRARVW